MEKIDYDGVYQTVKKLIDGLPPEERATDTLYRSRLDICSDCKFLNRGTCEKCGCFVEFRAAKKDETCPYEKHLW